MTKAGNKGKGSKLVLKGALTIQQIAGLKKKTMQSFEKTGDVVFEFKNVTEVDLSLIQLLLSARQTAADSDKFFTLSGECPQLVKQAFEQFGFSRQMSDLVISNGEVTS